MVNIAELQVEVGGVVFGHGTDAPLESIRGLGTGPLRDREWENAGEDGRAFGTEYRDGQTILFAGAVVREGDPAGAWDRVSALQDVFDDPELLRNPRAVTTCRVRRPGRPARVAYGRPEEFDFDNSRQAIGLLPFDGAFRKSDPHWYDDVEQSIRVRLSSQSSSHIILDDDGFLVAPVTTTAVARRASIIENGGKRPTWPVLRFAGPITNPTATLVDGVGRRLWSLGMVGTVPAGQVAVFDTRPWSRSAALESGAPLPGRMTLDSAPSRSTIPPGEHELVCSGIDATGTSYFDASWRAAYRTL
ncbi:hypothetical protein [Aeromicrobium sp. Leaf291]|uniref:hypothetical protein n=1 Tax=Aeromicrobium sp. Leaf291 TaxID=1736325 RepID=UPI000700FE3D|nr:hypothetical protein [Aeromicrobium sp. Leaf291]KQP81568.1 hypothetical protein ASF35_16185 [Aeromicrobium sp. Leaf291]